MLRGMDTVQTILDELANAYDLTDSEIARRVESSQPTIWRIRTGQSKDCASSLYRALAELREELQVERRSKTKKAA